MAGGPLGMMLKGFGIDVDPVEVVAMVQKMAQDIVAMRDSHLRTEEMVRQLWAIQFGDSENGGYLKGQQTGDGTGDNGPAPAQGNGPAPAQGNGQGGQVGSGSATAA